VASRPDFKKSLKEINQQPLVSYTVGSAVESDWLDKGYASTASDIIAEIASKYSPCVPFRRPAKLSGSEAGLRAVVEHVINEIQST
jgi:CMP-N-acetylneuraminic acid synthetase